MKNIIQIALALLISTTAFAAADIEHLAGITTSREGITLQLSSGGCTSKKSFEVRKRVEAGETVIEFIRLEPDFCEAYLPYGTLLTYSWKELGLKRGDEVRVGNSVTASARVE